MSSTRLYVEAFADAMEAKLNQNRHKGDCDGWTSLAGSQLLIRLRAEVRELEDAVDAEERSRCGCREAACPHAHGQDLRRAQVVAECADVANFAMMIADVAGDLQPKFHGDGDGRDRLDRFFGLSRASYLTAPRSLLEAMPDAWQGALADLLEQLNARFRWPLYSDANVEVRLRDRSGLYLHDELAAYRHPDADALAEAERRS